MSLKTPHSYQSQLIKQGFFYASLTIFSGSSRNFSLSSIRPNSAPATATHIWIDVPIEPIPPPPPPPPTLTIDQIAENLNALGEPTLSSLGLCGSTPIGWMQSGFEYLHVTTALPWWATIALSTVIIRVLMTPAVIMSHKNAAPLTNAMPQLNRIHDNLLEAKKRKDKIAATRFENERLFLLQRAKYQPLKNGLMPVLTLQTLLTYMISIQYMVDTPVKALESGGLYWFGDLAAQDPFYVLPVISCATYWLSVVLRSDGYVSTSDSRSLETVFQQVAPILLFPVVMYLPAAMNVCFAAYNLTAVVQVSFRSLPTRNCEVF